MAAIGDIIGGCHKILEEISRGGMLIVYLAKKLQSKVDSKIQRMIRKHKQEPGIRDERRMMMQ